MSMLEKIFSLTRKKSSIKQECLAGLTSFMSMGYLVFVVPAMLADAGMPRESATAATIWVTILGTLFMGLFPRLPLGVAPGLGLTAFFAYYVCGPAGHTWQTGLGAVFISGLAFLLLTLTRVRHAIINAIPMDMKYAIMAGIGAFIAFIGMRNCGLVIEEPSSLVALGDVTNPETLLAVAGIFLTTALMALQVRGAIIIGIVAITVLGLLLGQCAPPNGVLFAPIPLLPTETFMQLDIKGALHHGLFSIIFTLTMVELFENMGVLISLAQKAGFMHKNGQIQHIGKALVVDSSTTIFSAILGAPTTTIYLENALGVAEGGRTGLTALVIAGLFFLSLFCIPLIALVPSFATAPVLIIIGALMMQEVVHIQFNDFAVALPAFLAIICMPLTANIATGFGIGFISWVGVRILSGRFSELNPIMIVIALCFCITFSLRLQ